LLAARQSGQNPAQSGWPTWFSIVVLSVFARRVLPFIAIGLAVMPGLAVPCFASDRAARPYYVEFRARPSNDIGHSVVMYGRRGPDGQPAERHFASFVPGVDGRKGMIFPIYGSVRASPEDIHTPPMTSFRVSVTAAEYARVRSTVHRLKEREHLWHAFLFNCNQLPAEVAGAIGLRRPPSILPPNLWVDTLRALNGP
jgi:hypothetical protein